METVNNVAAAAAKAVWGEQTKTNETGGKEPISGKSGDTSKGEPYDAGNLETPIASPTEDKSAEFSKTTGLAAEAENTPDNPSTDLKLRDTPKDSSKGQEDTRSPDDPLTNPKSAPTDVNDADDGPNEAQKLDGAGPKPVEEVARERGGDAGKIETKPAPDGDKAPRGEEDAKDAKEEEEKGTGEIHVKTTGLQADGGDFDATKPGAGIEADRLMETKGIKSADPKKSTDAPSTPSSKDSGTKEKKSPFQKIKDKLHRK